jgi:hypothetical protein
VDCQFFTGASHERRFRVEIVALRPRESVKQLLDGSMIVHQDLNGVFASGCGWRGGV